MLIVRGLIGTYLTDLAQVEIRIRGRHPQLDKDGRLDFLSYHSFE